jgi:hypothetical protein
MHAGPIKVLLQTTISATADDWSIARFSQLGKFLAEQRDARGIAMGVSRVMGRAFNIAVAFAAKATLGPAIAQSSFHHFLDYNWNPRFGRPSFVTEFPGGGMQREPRALLDTQRYVLNAALWLAGSARLG